MCKGKEKRPPVLPSRNVAFDRQAVLQAACKRHLVGIFKFVSQTRTARGFNTQSHANAFATFGHVACDVSCRSIGQGNSHLDLSKIKFADI